MKVLMMMGKSHMKRKMGEILHGRALTTSPEESSNGTFWMEEVHFLSYTISSSFCLPEDECPTLF
jgi:hypothetical protein